MCFSCNSSFHRALNPESDTPSGLPSPITTPMPSGDILFADNRTKLIILGILYTGTSKTASPFSAYIEKITRENCMNNASYMSIFIQKVFAR